MVLCEILNQREIVFPGTELEISDKVLYEVEDEDMASKALQMAEEKIEYKSFIKIDRNESLKKLNIYEHVKTDLKLIYEK